MPEDGSGYLITANTMPMFRVLRALPLCLLVSLCNQHVRGQSNISAELEATRQKFNMTGMAAIAVRQGRVIAQGAAGYRRQGNSTPLLLSDAINIGSCTKWITATVAGRLVDRGDISWTTRVRDVFTNYQTFNSAFHNATLEQFLAHVTGLQSSSTFSPRHWSNFTRVTGTTSELRHWVTEAVLRDAPEVTPGNFLYANQGYAVAATMLEIASGKDWETLVREEIFGPLRMTTGTFGRVYNDDLPPKAPVGHSLYAGQTIGIPLAAGSADLHIREEAAFGPGGTIACTLHDWAKFLHMQTTVEMSGYVNSTTASDLQSSFSGTEGYGRGVFAVDRSWAFPGQALTHGGWMFGHRTVFWMAPAKEFLLMVFSNTASETDDRTFLALDEIAAMLVSRYADAITQGPPLEVPVARPLRRDASKVVFEFSTLPGVRYYAETSTDLRSWAPANGAGGQIATHLQATIVDAKPGLRKFYRAKVFP